MFKRVFYFAVLAVVFTAGALFGQRANAPSAWAQQQNETLPLEQLQELAEVFALIKRGYVEEVPSDQLIEQALRGMVSALDPHSSYLSEEDLAQFQRGLTSEEYGGVGIYVGRKDDWVEVIAPIYGTPAYRADLKSGDLILKIDGTSTQGMEISDAVSRMRGKVGNILLLDVLPAAGGDVRKVELVRETIVSPSVLSGLIDGGYGYIRVTRFQNETNNDFVKNLNGLYAENGAPLKGLVLDLRDNPGGYLDAGIGVASAFLPADAVVVSDEGRAHETKKFLADKRRYAGNLQNQAAILSVPMVILVNNGSASASEIVAGALQDHRRGVVIGTRTYGKASVQTLQPLQSSKGKTALRLTQARYFTPSGRYIQGRGISPDVTVRQGERVLEEEEGFTLREGDLRGHLENDSAEESGGGDGAESNGNGGRPPFIDEDDYQYAQALLVLKALGVVARQ